MKYLVKFELQCEVDVEECLNDMEIVAEAVAKYCRMGNYQIRPCHVEPLEREE